VPAEIVTVVGDRETTKLFDELVELDDAVDPLQPLSAKPRTASRATAAKARNRRKRHPTKPASKTPAREKAAACTPESLRSG